jgi:hypothetical protein
MPNIELTLNPKKALKRKDLKMVGEIFIKASKDKKIEALILTITDDMKGTPNSMMFPFQIVDEK